MKKFLGMFLTTEERVDCNNGTYMHAIERVRWVMRRYDYEDIYNQVLLILTQTIQSMKVIGDCDCIYFIQLIARYKMHDFVTKAGKDAASNTRDISRLGDSFGYDEESMEEALDRLTFNQSHLSYEDDLISSLIDNVDISILNRNDDIYRCFSAYEKFIMYLRNYLELTNRQILSVLKHETEEGLIERLEDIVYRKDLIMKEGE